MHCSWTINDTVLLKKTYPSSISRSVGYLTSYLNCPWSRIWRVWTFLSSISLIVHGPVSRVSRLQTNCHLYLIQSRECELSVIHPIICHSPRECRLLHQSLYVSTVLGSVDGLSPSCLLVHGPEMWSS